MESNQNQLTILPQLLEKKPSYAFFQATGLKKQISDSPQQRVNGRAAGYFSKVQTIVDYQSEKLNAVKYFKDLNSYLEKKQIYKQLQDEFESNKKQLLRLSIIPHEYNDQKMAIYYAAGVCSLDQLIQCPEYSCTADQAVHVFQHLLEFVLLLKEKSFYHSDLKPENIQLVRYQDSKNQYRLKVIDFGCLKKDTLEYHQHTPAFFNNPKRNYDQYGQVYFLNEDERLKNEFFTVIRTIQQILLDQSDKKMFFIGKSTLDQQIRQKNLKNLQDYLNNKYSKKEKDHLLSYILRFITEKGLEEKYSINDLKNLFDYLQKRMSKQQKQYLDTQNLIQRIIDKQKADIKRREDPLKLLLGPINFVSLFGSYQESYSEPFDLIETLKEQLFIIQNDSQDQGNIVLIGQSGSGKTLLLINLMKELAEQKQNKCDFVLIKLRELAAGTANNNHSTAVYLINQINQQIVQKSDQSKKMLVLLLDGYDEFSEKNSNMNQIIRNYYQNYKCFKILVTTRPQHANLVYLINNFNNPKIIYICPFDENQRINYIDNFLAICAKNQELAQYYEIFERTDQYLQFLDRFSSLDQLAVVPFTLALLTIIIPKLKSVKQYQQQSHQFTKYELYGLFINDYMNKRVAVFSTDFKFNHFIIQRYGQSDCNSRIVKEAKLFNCKCSWLMLKLGKWTLFEEDTRTVFEEIQLAYSNELLEIFQQISLAIINEQNSYVYIHKSIYEFFIAQSIIEETLAASGQPIDEEKSLMGTAFLRFDLDLLSLVSEHLIELPLDSQYSLFFETWYRSVLLTRKIKSGNDQERMHKLERIGSNCLNLLAGPYRCDLTERDFSDCCIPHAYLNKRDLSGSEEDS